MVANYDSGIGSGGESPLKKIGAGAKSSPIPKPKEQQSAATGGALLLAERKRLRRWVAVLASAELFMAGVFCIGPLSQPVAYMLTCLLDVAQIFWAELQAVYNAF